MTSKCVIKITFLFLFTFSVFVKARAQDSTKVQQATAVKSLNKIRLTLLGLAYEREQKVGKLTTIYAGAGVAGTFLVEYNYTNLYTGQYTTNTYFDISPNFYAGIRKYYHFDARNKKGKKTANNSSNYFGLDLTSYLGTLFDKSTTVDWEIGITPQWGIQRSVGKKVNFELSFGPTVRMNDIETYYGVDARIGFSFFTIEKMAVVEQIFPSLTWRIRHIAMYPDQPMDFVKLKNDFDGIHFGIYVDHELTGVVSLFMEGNVGQFRKLAILPEAQGNGLGKQLMEYLIDFCKIQKLNKLWCNARVNAKEFYSRLGFSETDKTYSADGYDFVIMEKEITISD